MDLRTRKDFFFLQYRTKRKKKKNGGTRDTVENQTKQRAGTEKKGASEETWNKKGYFYLGFRKRTKIFRAKRMGRANLG